MLHHRPELGMGHLAESAEKEPDHPLPEGTGEGRLRPHIYPQGPGRPRREKLAHLDVENYRAPFAFLFNQVTQAPFNNPLVIGQDWQPEEWEPESEDEEQAPHVTNDYSVQGVTGQVGALDPQGNLYQLTQDPIGAGNETPNHLGEGQRNPASPHLFQDVEATRTPGEHPIHLKGGGKEPPPKPGVTNHGHLLQGEATGGQKGEAKRQNNPSNLGGAGKGETGSDARNPGNKGELDRNAHPCVVSGPRSAYANRPMAAPPAAPPPSSQNSGQPSRRPTMWGGLTGAGLACMLPAANGHSTDGFNDTLNATSAVTGTAAWDMAQDLFSPCIEGGNPWD